MQIGSAIGSGLGQLIKLTEGRLRVLVACGAAGGIAATFNAPLAGVFFAMELILRDFTAQSFGMVVIASVTASVIARAALGDQPFLHLPAFTVEHLWEYALFALLGLIAGVVGVLFTRVLYLIEDLCDRLWRGPEWLRPAAGGVLLGVVLLLLPEMYGVGYPVLSNGVAGRYGITFLLILLLGKVFATSLTIGIGGSGGVFAPSLFIGAMLGAAYGQTAHDLVPGSAGSAGAYALIGMGAVFAGAARAPITAVIIMFELTGEYSIILPLMAAIALATGISHLLSRDTIYTLKLRRRGVDLDDLPQSQSLVAVPAGTVMEPLGTILPATSSLRQAATSLTAAPHDQLAVVDAAQKFLGVITVRAVADALADGAEDGAAIGPLVERPAAVRVEQSLAETLDTLDDARGAPVPVLDVDGHALCGWLTHQQVLRALSGIPQVNSS